MHAKGFRFFLGLICISASCTSARMSDSAADRFFRSGEYDQAIEKLKAGVKGQGENGRDLLLYLLDLGLTLHTAGKYEESNQAFLKAEKIAEIKDYTSLATEASTLLTSDNIKDYKGEDFEKVMINTYLAMNYALLGSADDSLVEARKVNRLLLRMVEEGQKNYQQNAFARYLSAVLYESQQEYNDALIDYKKTAELEPEFPEIRRDLWRMAKLLHRTDVLETLKEVDHVTPEDQKLAMAPLQKGVGEIIVFFENGIAPIKKPHPSFYQIPKFYPRYNPVLYAEVDIDGVKVGSTARLHDIEKTAIENLDEKYAGIIAKKIAGVVAKEVVGDQIAKQTNSPLLGFAAKIFFYVSDQADLRSWNLLPKDLQLMRVVVPAGTHTVRLRPVGAEPLPEKTVQVKAREKVFVNLRYIPR